MSPYVIILNGRPCTGKSYFLQKLSRDLDLSYITRDEFKELLFDDLGIGDQEWSRKLGGASYSLLFNMFEKLLKTNKSFMLEGNFNHEQHHQKIKLMFEKYGYQSVEVFLETEPSVLFERYKKRWESGERHRGHVDNERFDEFEKKLNEDVVLPLNVGE
ncbi:MAG: ATP-binding protein, partial [Bacteriovorax sp.]|nr:ATP-binding protein [Bacteriovorax sp.]